MFFLKQKEWFQKKNSHPYLIERMRKKKVAKQFNGD
ncbi:hypothetical protein N568_0103975 [Lactococcus garvieae TRF1]|uniref:Uncharacterized protein n=1 Tax=Lactococcus garvieae TRF1 TaxID=1380772 RepID=V8ASI7_9LACT|nr:hypothetical protein N568_0103975 [Lactococcus garvieae TRF1]